MESRIVVSGLRETSRNLRALSMEAQKELSAEMKTIAQSVVVDVQRRLPSSTGSAAKSVKARGGTKGAGIGFGGPRAPHYPWLDFGGSTKVDVDADTRSRAAVSHSKVGTGKGRVYRPVIRGGRYLYPAIADNMRTVQDAVVDALNRINAKYGSRIDE